MFETKMLCMFFGMQYTCLSFLLLQMKSNELNGIVQKASCLGFLTRDREYRFTAAASGLWNPFTPKNKLIFSSILFGIYNGSTLHA